MVNCKFLYYVLLLGRFHAFSSLSAIKMNSTEVQNPRRKHNRVENYGASSMKGVYAYHVFGSVLACMCKVCSRASETLLLVLLTLSLTINSSSDSKAFLRFIAFSGSPTAYTIHCMHYGITLWAYLSEPLIKDGHKRLSSMEKLQYNVLKSLDHTLPLRMWYTETLHAKKMADL